MNITLKYPKKILWSLRISSNCVDFFSFNFMKGEEINAVAWNFQRSYNFPYTGKKKRKFSTKKLSIKKKRIMTNSLQRRETEDRVPAFLPLYRLLLIEVIDLKFHALRRTIFS